MGRYPNCVMSCNLQGHSLVPRDHHEEVAQHDPPPHTTHTQHTHTHTHIHTYTHKHTTRTHTHTRTHTYTHTHTHTHLHTHTRTNTNTHTCTHTHSHTHTRAPFILNTHVAIDTNSVVFRPLQPHQYSLIYTHKHTHAHKSRKYGHTVTTTHI